MHVAEKNTERLERRMFSGMSSQEAVATALQEHAQTLLRSGWGGLLRHMVDPNEPAGPPIEEHDHWPFQQARRSYEALLRADPRQRETAVTAVLQEDDEKGAVSLFDPLSPPRFTSSSHAVFHHSHRAIRGGDGHSARPAAEETGKSQQGRDRILLCRFVCVCVCVCVCCA